MSSGRGRRRGTGGPRNLARRRAMQALYQWQITGQSGQDIYLQFSSEDENEGVDPELFRELVRSVIDQSKQLDEEIAAFSDRPVSLLDPVERGILLIGLYELKNRPDVPYRVVINEAVELCRTYGAEDGFKFVNALLDKAAKRFRQQESPASEHDGGESGETPCP